MIVYVLTVIVLSPFSLTLFDKNFIEQECEDFATLLIQGVDEATKTRNFVTYTCTPIFRLRGDARFGSLDI